MNRALGHLCAHIGEPPQNGEMNEMTLSFRHRIRNSSSGGLRPSTLQKYKICNNLSAIMRYIPAIFHNIVCFECLVVILGLRCESFQK